MKSLQTWKKPLPIGPLTRGFSQIFTGTLVSQFALFVTTLLIARIYSVETIGIYGSIVALAAILSPLMTGQLQIAVVSTSSDADAWKLARSALVLAFTVFLFLQTLTQIIFALGYSPAQHPVLKHWVWVPFLALAYGVFGVMLASALRQRQYRSVAFRPIVQNLTGGTGQLVLGGLNPNVMGLVVGDLIGRLVGIVLLIQPFLKLQVAGIKSATNSGFWRRYSAIPLRYLPATFFDTLSTSLWILCASLWFGVQEAGYVSLTQRFLIIPISLIATALGQVLMAEAANAIRNGQDLFKLKRLISALVALATLIGAIILLAGPLIFSTLLGNEWEPAGELARWLCVSFTIGFIWSPLSTLFVSFELWSQFLGIMTLSVLLSISGGWIAYSLGASWFLTVASIAMGGAAAQLSGLIFLSRYLKHFRSALNGHSTRKLDQ